MGRHIEHTELTGGLTGEPPASNSTPDSRHPLAIECDSIAQLGQQIMRQGDYCAITFPSRRRSTRSLRRRRL